MRWEEALERWRKWLAAGSEETARAHYHIVRAFWRSCGADLTTLTVEHLEDYVVRLSARVEAGELAPGTRSKYILNIRSFLHYCDNRDWLNLSLKKALITLRTLPSDVARPYELLTQEEAARLLEAAYDVRASAFLSVLIGAGLRNREAMLLRCADVYAASDGFYVRVMKGKWRKGRVVPVSQETYECVQRSIAGRGDGEFIFGRSNWTGARIVHCCADRAGIQKRVTPHSLRHYFAFQLAFVGNPEAGIPPAPLLVVAKLLGHNSLSALQRYLDHLRQADLTPYAAKLPTRRTEG